MMKKNAVSSKLILGSVLISAGVLSACSATDTDKIRNAQACLDSSTAATAKNCMTLVSGLNSKSASLIRCSAIMIFQGLSSPTKLQNTLTAMQGSNSSNVYAALAFTTNGSGTSNAADVTDATQAATECANSGSYGLSMLAGLAKPATSIASAGSCNPVTAACVNANKASFSVSSATDPTVTLISNAYSQNCTGTISSSYTTFCAQYSAASAANPGNPVAITNQFIQNMN